MNPYVRGLFSLATLAFITLYGWSVRPAPLAWGTLAAMALLYQVIIWARQSWWTRTTYTLFVCLLIGLTLAISLLDGGQPSDTSLLIPLVLLLAREQRDHRRLALVLAAATLATMVALSRLSPFTIPLLSCTLTLYVCIRAINLYKEAHRLGQLHLQALDEAHRKLQQAHAELQEASIHSMRYAALAERTRLAREMHDGLGHQLTSLIVQLQALEIMLPHDPKRAAEAVPWMLEVARRAMTEVRLAVREWHEDEGGLGLVAIQGLVSQSAAQAHLTIEFQQEGYLSDWPVEVGVALYRIVQEALTNIMRHAAATRATIKVEERDRQVLLTISDNGGYTADMGLVPGFGLTGIMERSQALGGSYALSQTQPHGLALRVTLPIRRANSPTENGRASGRTPAGDAHVAPAVHA